MAAAEPTLTASVAATIKQHRERQGLTLEALAEAAGVHRTSLGLVERGRRGMTIEVAARLCWALDLSLADVIAAGEAQARLLPGALGQARVRPGPAGRGPALDA